MSESKTIDVCESCIAMEAGMEPSYWYGDDEGFARSEAGWIEHADLVIAWTYADDDPDCEGYPVRHFGSGPCAICGSTLGGDYHTCTYASRQ